jgi:hypothetical protein
LKEIKVPKDLNNYFSLERLSLCHRFYAYLDTKDYQADGLFIKHRVHVKFLQEYGKDGSSYRMIFNAMRHLSEEISFKSDGRLQQRAEEVLNQAVDMLEQVREAGLMEAISEGMFADIKRLPENGKGLDGVVTKSPDYLNPFIDIFQGKE